MATSNISPLMVHISASPAASDPAAACPAAACPAGCPSPELCAGIALRRSWNANVLVVSASAGSNVSTEDSTSGTEYSVAGSADHAETQRVGS